MKNVKNFILENKVDIIFILVVIVVFSIFSANFAILHIQGSSMYPTYEHGDIMILRKSKKIDKGDIIVFESPKSWSANESKFIKRLIAKEGDVVEITSEDVRVNGEVLRDLNYQCDTDSSYIILNEGEYLVMGDNVEASNDSIAQYCLNNERFLINEERLIVYGEEFFLLGGLFQ